MNSKVKWGLGPILFFTFAAFDNSMQATYKEYDNLNLPAFEREMLETWKNEDAFNESIRKRDGAKPFVFYEGPPSANGVDAQSDAG